MKKNPYLLILGFSVAWTIGQAAFRAVPMSDHKYVMPQNALLLRADLLADKDDGERVLVTPRGKSYHKIDCRNVQGGELLRPAVARKRGYTACLVCGG